MTATNLIVPPPELVEQWRKEPEYTDCSQLATMVTMTTDRLMQLCEKSAQHGADQELEACCESLYNRFASPVHQAQFLAQELRDWLRAARRPKPPSLKEQALAVLDDCADGLDGAHENVLRRALESLDD